MKYRKRSILKDTYGQWIILSGFVISMSLVALIMLLNMSFMSGYQSTQAEIKFPKNDIRELQEETLREIKTMALYENNTEDIDDLLKEYGYMVSNMYASHGQFVNISTNAKNSTSSIHGVDTIILTVNMSFSDGTTEYQEELTSEIASHS